MSSTKQISLRLPIELLNAINELSKEQETTRTNLIISLLQGALGDSEKPKSAIQKTTAKLAQVYPKMSPSIKQSGLQASLDNLAEVIETSTTKQEELVAHLSQLTTKAAQAVTESPRSPAEAKAEAGARSSSTKPSAKASKPKGQRKRKTTKQGGKPAPMYLYEDREATLREHLQAALPQLNKRQLDRARSNINRKIRGRADKKSTKKRTPGEAIAHEIGRLRKELGLED